MTTSQILTLDRLTPGLPARICRIGGTTTDDVDSDVPLETLLLDLGFEEGAEIEVRHQGPLDGPLAVRVDGRLIALRPTDAAVVTVEVLPHVSSAESDS